MSSISESRLTPAARRYLLIDQGILAVGATGLINAAIAWSVFREQPAMRLTGEMSIVSDTEATCFFLPFITCLVVSHLTRFEIQRGRFPALPQFSVLRFLGEYAAASAFPKAMAMGVIGRLALAPLLVSILKSTEIAEIALNSFLIWKGVLTGVVGGLLCPLCAWLAMHTDEPLSRGRI